jgi:hypothetical protein
VAGQPDHENVFVRGSTGNLYLDYWDGSWHWVNLGNNGVPLAGDPAVINYPASDGLHENVFVRDSTGDLSHAYWDGSWHWVNLGNNGVPLAGDPAVTNYSASDGLHENVFVRDSTGNLSHAYWNGGWNWVDLGNPGVPSGGDPAVINYQGNFPLEHENVFVRGSNGNLYLDVWDGSGWTWVDQGNPDPSNPRWVHADLTALSGAPRTASVAFGYTTVDDHGDTARVVYTGWDSHVHELRLPRGQGWMHADLSVLSGAPDVYHAEFAYFTTGPGMARIVYTGTDRHIHELRLPQPLPPGQGWMHADLSVLSGAPDAIDDPVAYVTYEGALRVVYMGTDRHIHELRLPPGQGWSHADLSILSGAPDANGPPAALRTDDGLQVVYTGTDRHIHELLLPWRPPLPPGPGWIHADLSVLSGAPDTGFVNLFAYNYGPVRVVYMGQDNHIHELRHLPGQGWFHADLSALSGAPDADGPPSVCVSNGARVMYLGTDFDIHELWLPPPDQVWIHTDLSVLSGAPEAVFGPSAYVTLDGIPRVLYRGFDDDIHELRLDPGSGGGGAGAAASLPSGAPMPADSSFAFIPSSWETALMIRGLTDTNWTGPSSNPPNRPCPEDGMALGRLINVDRVSAAIPGEVHRVARPRSKSESRFDDPLVDNLALALLS